MNQPIFLKRFEYFIPGAELNGKYINTGGDNRFKAQKPVLNVNIDFENSDLHLESNSLSILTTYGSTELKIPISDRNIKVNATIFPGLSIDLTDYSNDGLLFTLEGIIEYGNSARSCSGLLMLESTPGGEWYL